MSRIFEQLQRIERERVEPAGRQSVEPALDTRRESDPFQVVAVVSNKGGVGKTTVATNLAVYLRALDEELPILLISLDEQPMLERLFELEPDPGAIDIASAVRSGTLRGAIREGQFGVSFVPTTTRSGRLRREITDRGQLRAVLRRSGLRGLVIIDTKSDLETVTQSAISAADLTVVAVKDHASLVEARKIFALMQHWERPRWRARLLASLVDLRVKYDDAEAPDILTLLHSEIRQHGFPFFETFLSRSPKVEGLVTNPENRARSVLHGARGTVVDRQFAALAREVQSNLRQLSVGLAFDPAPTPEPDADPLAELEPIAAAIFEPLPLAASDPGLDPFDNLEPVPAEVEVPAPIPDVFVELDPVRGRITPPESIPALLAELEPHTEAAPSFSARVKRVLRGRQATRRDRERP